VFSLKCANLNTNGLIFGINFLFLNLDLNGLSQSGKHQINIMSRLSWGFHKEHMILSRHLKSFLIGDSSSEFIQKILIFQITLVSYKHHYDLIVGVAFSLVQPFLDVVVGLSACDVIDENHSDWTSIVGSGDGFEGLLPCLN